MGVSLRPDRQSSILSATTDEDAGGDPEYGPLSPSGDYLEELSALIHPIDVLGRAGYILQQLSPEDIHQKRRCLRCNRKWQKKPRRHEPLRQTPQKKPPRPGSSQQPSGVTQPPQDQPRQQFRCRFHDGKVNRGKWTCCGGNPFAPPCSGKDDHTPRIYANGELERQWSFFHTPTFNPGLGKKQPAAAVVIDCEMGTNIYGESELIRVSVIDYFSRTILLDTLVWPDVRMIHYNTKFSGVTRQAMIDAKQRKTCLFGRASVRKHMWKFVGPETIVVGHAAHGDLASIRWIHHRVVDTLIIETQKRPPPPPPEEEKAPNTEEAGQNDDDDDDDDADDDDADDDDDEIEGNDTQDREKAREKEKAQKSPRKAWRGGGVPITEEVEDGKRQAQQIAGQGGQQRRQEGGLSLKALALSYLSRTIQIKGQGHDSVEDALATRDVLHWNIHTMLRRREAEVSQAM